MLLNYDRKRSGLFHVGSDYGSPSNRTTYGPSKPLLRRIYRYCFLDRVADPERINDRLKGKFQCNENIGSAIESS